MNKPHRVQHPARQPIATVIGLLAAGVVVGIGAAAGLRPGTLLFRAFVAGSLAALTVRLIVPFLGSPQVPED